MMNTRRWAAPVAATAVALAVLVPTGANAEPENTPTFTKVQAQSEQNQPSSQPDDPYTGLPNVVVIVTDDQAKGTMDAMPNVRSQIRDAGVTIETGIIPTAICCPSRSALLSGELAHSTGVYENVGNNGGWPTFNASGAEADTFAVALDNAGYKTGLFGKYLNGYALADDTFVPPGWDQFRAIQDDSGNPQLSAGAYYDYDLHGTGADESFGSSAADYSTDVITDKAVDFIDETSPSQPFLLYYATSGGHAPFTAAPRHEDTWSNEPLSPAATQLTSQRPSFWPDTLQDYNQQQNRLRKQHEALRSVDDGVGEILAAVGEERLDNTLVVYLSDNGLQFGEHGLTNKSVPYNGSTEVPMYLRWDGTIDPDTTYSRPVTNIDLAATIADAADVNLPGAEGVSFLAPNRPTGVLVEAMSTSEHPAYCGWRTNQWLFVEYHDVNRRELYNYNLDPDELENKAPDNPTKVDELRAEAMAACNPTPPGFNW